MDFAQGGALKSVARRIGEHVYLTVRDGHLPLNYYFQGFGQRDLPAGSYLPAHRFRWLRDSRNRSPRNGREYDCAVLLRDKHVFGLLAASLGHPTPRTIALLTSESVEWTAPRELGTWSDLLAADVDGFCKPVDGIKGIGAFRLQVTGTTLFVDGRLVTLDALRSRLDGQYVLQERLKQHPLVRQFHPASLNTLRIITVLEAGQARVLAAHLRVGVGGNSVDSGEAGGVVIAVDLGTGRLRSPGVYRAGANPWLTNHPDTGVPFDGVAVPFFEEAVTLANRFHEDLRHIHTVGWDVAITPEGPSIVEGNDNWGGATAIALEREFARRFVTLFED